MKLKTLIPIILLCTPFICVAVFFVRCNNAANAGRKQTFKELLGSYTLDINKTKLEGNYKKDTNIFRNLSITFLPDSTFTMNMKVPFMYNSTGKWTAGNVNEWCWLLFDGFNYGYKNKNSGSQFTRPYIENSDTFFLINAATPRDNEKTISDLYFKKVKSE
jgi:hypothetical protein